MSFPIKLVLVSVLGLGGTAGVVYLGGKAVDFSNVTTEDDDSVIETFEDKYKTSLIKKGKNNKAKGDNRRKKLGEDSGTNLDPDLKKIKDKQDSTGEDVRKWCEGVVIQPHSPEDKARISGIEKYCTYTIEDQVSKLINKKEESDWEVANKRLTDLEKDKVPEKLKSVYDSLKATDSKDPLALQKHCHSQYDLMFKGNKDPVYLEVSRFCTQVSQGKKK